MKALVTGGGGFLGRAIVRQLLHRGDQVVVLGRNPYPKLSKLGVKVVTGDVRDEKVVNQVCDGVETVFHTAAIAGIWGPWEMYHSINTIGTRHVVDACVRNDVQKLVFTSSPSVVFNGKDQQGINEDTLYPKKYLCHYPHTKALAEQHVLDSHDKTRLLTCALRPHLIWGPGDQHLIPRLIERASRDKLKRVGDGDNRVDMIYVDNAAAAHLQAADALQKDSAVGGKAYFVSEGEPVNLWMWINEILMLAGLPRVRRSVSFQWAYRAGHAMEMTYEWMKWMDHEPLMTRFLACQLAHSHYYDVSRAREDFGMRSVVSFEEAMDRLARYLQGEKAIADQTLPYNRSAKDVEAGRVAQAQRRSKSAASDADQDRRENDFDDVDPDLEYDRDNLDDPSDTDDLDEDADEDVAALDAAVGYSSDPTPGAIPRGPRTSNRSGLDPAARNRGENPDASSRRNSTGNRERGPRPHVDRSRGQNQDSEFDTDSAERAPGNSYHDDDDDSQDVDDRSAVSPAPSSIQYADEWEDVDPSDDDDSNVDRSRNRSNETRHAGLPGAGTRAPEQQPDAGLAEPTEGFRRKKKRR